MSTFRIHLGRPSVEPPSYDWGQTVVAATGTEAVARAYQSWVDSSPSYIIPALSGCHKSVREIGTNLLLAASSISPAQQAFIDNIEGQVGKLLSTQLDGKFSPVNYPQGFNYGITYGNNAYYNAATLGDLDALLGMASNGMLDLTGAAFSNLYTQVLQAVTFNFSQQDQATMNKQDTAASAQVASILIEFQNAGGTFSTPLPFGGKLQDVFDQLTAKFGSMDKIPDSLNALRNAVASYKALAGTSYALHNRYYAATARIQAAMNNTLKPNPGNGGMQTGLDTYYVGFTPNKLPTANQLIGGLQTASNAVQVQINLSDFSSRSSNLSISGGASFSIPIADILNISIGGSASYDLSRYSSSATNVTMDMKYPGVTLLASTPSALSSDNVMGWYANDILKEVAEKTGEDATGYQLNGHEYVVSELFGPGKAFSRLKTFVISQQPTITLTFTGTDVSKVTSDLKVGASIKLDLFGIFPVGGASASYSVKNVDSKSSSGSVTVTFGPPEVSGTIPIQQQVAYVLGGVASYPPEDI